MPPLLAIATAQVHNLRKLEVDPVRISVGMYLKREREWIASGSETSLDV